MRRVIAVVCVVTILLFPISCWASKESGAFLGGIFGGVGGGFIGSGLGLAGGVWIIGSIACPALIPFAIGGAAIGVGTGYIIGDQLDPCPCPLK
jgi:hypothetical protein